MLQKPILMAAVALVSPFAGADVEPGNLILAYPTSADSTVQVTALDGTVTTQVYGTGAPLPSVTSWISTARMPDGRFLVHNNGTNAYLAFFTPSGLPLSYFLISPTNYASDIDVFADGTIGVCTRGEGIRLYNDLGASLGSLNPAGMQNAMGCRVADDDTIWVTDLMNWPGPTDGKIWNIDRAGTVLHEFVVGFDPSDVDIAPDGTLWVSSYDGEIKHYTVDGVLQGQFTPQIDSGAKTLWSLAVGDDGVIWASGHYDSKVRGYDAAGNILYVYDSQATGNSTYSVIAEGVGWATGSCYGDGSANTCPCGNMAGSEGGCMNSTGAGSTLTVNGNNSAAADGLELLATQLPPGRPAAAFVGDQLVSAGQGAPFGDGLRCAGGSLQFLGVRISNQQGVALWTSGMRAQGGWNAADTRYFQIWYRDTNSPCSTGANTTNAMEVTFTP